MKAIYKMNVEWGRQGSLEGVFVADVDDVKCLVDNGIEVYFGEALGKHSEVYCNLTECDLTKTTDNPLAVKIFEENDLESGYNPFKESIHEYYEYGMEWDSECIQDLIDFLRKGIIPKGEESNYSKWLEEEKED